MRFSGEAVSDTEIEVWTPPGLEKLISHVCLKEIIDEADLDMNGLIDYTEFFNLMAPNNT